MANPNLIFSERAAEPVGPYPHARLAGNFLFVSGIGPRERGKSEIPGVTLDAQGKVLSYDIGVQCHSVFKNIGYILEDAGTSFDNVVDVTVFLTNMKDFEVMNRVYGEYLSQARPARTTVEVTALPTPIAVEIKLVAMI